jgi:hypothetical protein
MSDITEPANDAPAFEARGAEPGAAVPLAPAPLRIYSKAIPMNLMSAMAPWSAWFTRLTYWMLPRFFPSKLVPLKELTFIHFARWVIIPADGFPHLAPEQPQETLRHDYLLFCSNYNGHWDQYLDAFSDVLAGGLDSMWHGSLNWVEAKYVASLKRYVSWHPMRADTAGSCYQCWHPMRPGTDFCHYYYCAYPEANSTDVKAALDLNDELARFRDETPENESAKAFAARYTVLLRRVQHWLGSIGPTMVDADVVALAAGFVDPITPPPFQKE